MEQQFSLSWNNFHGNLSKGFAGLLGNGEFVDVTIAVEGHLLQAHKVILSICSPYFKKMFQLNPCQHPIVVLRDITHKAMRDLLQFMYHGEVSVKREDFNSFIGTAEILQIKGLTNKETDEVSETDKDPKSNLDTQNENLNSESCASDTYDSSPNETPETYDIDIFKQRNLLGKLQQISDLKRKSEEILRTNYYSDILSAEKRQKINEINMHSKPAQVNQSHLCTFEELKKVYEENPVDITTSINPNNPNTNVTERNNTQNLAELSVEVKTECDDSDIIVSDPAVCTSHEPLEGKKPLMMPLALQAQQDSALSLVVNGSENQLPVRYKYIYSRKGHKQLVHRNFVYTKHSTTHGKTSWRCVQYFSLNRCPATVETIDAMIYTVNHRHNHEDCYEKLTRNNIYEMDGVK